jgi:hypothetical protein
MIFQVQPRQRGSVPGSRSTSRSSMTAGRHTAQVNAGAPLADEATLTTGHSGKSGGSGIRTDLREAADAPVTATSRSAARCSGTAGCRAQAARTRRDRAGITRCPCRCSARHSPGPGATPGRPAPVAALLRRSRADPDRAGRAPGGYGPTLAAREKMSMPENTYATGADIVRGAVAGHVTTGCPAACTANSIGFRR